MSNWSGWNHESISNLNLDFSKTSKERPTTSRTELLYFCKYASHKDNKPKTQYCFWQLLGRCWSEYGNDFLLYRIFCSSSVLCCLRINWKVQIPWRKRFQNSKYAPSLVHWTHKERTPASTSFLICLWKQKQLLKNRSNQRCASTSWLCLSAEMQESLKGKLLWYCNLHFCFAQKFHGSWN